MSKKLKRKEATDGSKTVSKGHQKAQVGGKGNFIGEPKRKEAEEEKTCPPRKWKNSKKEPRADVKHHTASGAKQLKKVDIHEIV